MGSDIYSILAVATFSIGSDIIDTGIDAGFAIQEETYNPPSAGFAIEVTDQMLLDAADPNGVEVDSNDDYDNRDSFISYVAVETGTYSMHIGCFANDYCTGTVAWEVLPTE